jgi:Flp pilus assembly protein TadG
MRRLHREERGTAVVEFAVVAVLFIGLIFSGITYGMIFWAKHTMTHAASEGARAALTVEPGKEADAATAAGERARSAVEASLGDRADHVTIDTTVADCEGSAQRCITVTVSYPYDEHPIVAPMPFMPFVPDDLVSTSVIELTPSF